MVVVSKKYTFFPKYYIFLKSRTRNVRFFYYLCENFLTMFEKFGKIGICDIVLMLHELHQRGYQQLRLLPGWSPNGSCVRWNIYPKYVVTEGTGSFERNHYGECPDGYHGSAGAPTYNLNPQEMADHFLTVAPKLCADAKLPDEEYVNWFSILVNHALKEEYPTAFGDFFPEGKGWIVEPGEQYIPYPPFIETGNYTLCDMWEKFSFTGRSWSYYLDKCIYFKGERECPPTILKEGKEELWKYERWWVYEHFPYKPDKNQSCEDYFKQIIKSYKNLGLSHFRKHDGVCISMKAFLYQRYISQDKNATIDGFKQWYDDTYYLKNTPSKISKDYLLHLTLAYKGEGDCPAKFDGQMMGKIGMAESIAVDNLLSLADNLPKEWGYEFYLMVAMLISKWSPYDFMKVLDLYFQDFSDFKMKVLEGM